MTTPMAATSPAPPSRARFWAAPAMFVLALAFYHAGMARGLLWGDSAEMQVLAVTGGVAHPSGYPLFTLLAQPFVRLLGGDPAYLVNLFSAVFAAATLALLTAFLLHRGLRVPAACASAIAWGTSFTFWTTANRAEVYSLASFVALGGVWCTLAALEHGARPARLAAGFLLGLSLSGHLVFAPMAMVAGVALAWRVPRAGWVWLADEIALLSVFLLGLSPYLYLTWADGHHVGYDYLRLVEQLQWPAGHLPEWFRSPLARTWWLLTSRNELPAMGVRVGPYTLAKNTSDIACLLALFELGPITFALSLIGALKRRSGAHAGETRLLAAVAVASAVFALLFSAHRVVTLFLFPCYLVCIVFAGHALGAIHERLARRPGRAIAAATVLLLPLASMLCAQGARLAAYDHPIGPLRSRVYEEDEVRQAGLFPTFAGYDEPRRFVESAATRFPDSALVVVEWQELMPLTYLQMVEHRRTDLTLQAAGYPALLTAVGAWQRRYTPAQRPVVVVGPFVPMSRHFDRVDTLRLTTGRPVWVARTPLVRLDSPWTPPAPAKRARR